MYYCRRDTYRDGDDNGESWVWTYSEELVSLFQDVSVGGAVEVGDLVALGEGGFELVAEVLLGG